jgi:hypothetical protein
MRIILVCVRNMIKYCARRGVVIEGWRVKPTLTGTVDAKGSWGKPRQTFLSIARCGLRQPRVCRRTPMVDVTDLFFFANRLPQLSHNKGLSIVTPEISRSERKYAQCG